MGVVNGQGYIGVHLELDPRDVAVEIPVIRNRLRQLDHVPLFKLVLLEDKTCLKGARLKFTFPGQEHESVLPYGVVPLFPDYSQPFTVDVLATCPEMVAQDFLRPSYAFVRYGFADILGYALSDFKVSRCCCGCSVAGSCCLGS